jgi:UDP-N-acetylmuramate--L-alanine ligase/UDP-N-acetylenolpyruvoylglucosamine reductase
MVGVGGMHLSGIARVLAAWGHSVSGSDLRATPLTDALSAQGVTVLEGHRPEHVGDAELVVTTSAAPDDNPELAEARRRGVPVLKRHDFVAKLLEGRFSIAVAGTHGKTTTSGLVASMLVRAGRSPTYLIGGEVRDLGTNAAPGEGNEIVIEADEFDRALLAYGPDIAIVTNVEPDHLDIYGTFDEYAATFGQFLSQVKQKLLLCADNEKLRDLLASDNLTANVETYALDHDADWTADTGDLTSEGDQPFTVYYGGAEYGQFEITLAARHNVANALAAVAAGHALGVPLPVINEALRSYRGARRRFELVGEAAGVTVIDDYAHHPTEVRDNIDAARARFPGRRLAAVFQPHTYSRTKYLLDEFRTCFAGLDELFVLSTYAAREPASAGVDAQALATEIETPAAAFVATFEDAARAALDVLQPGHVFLTMGAGDVDAVGPLVLEGLQGRIGAPAMGPLQPLARDLEQITEVRLGEQLSRHTTFGVGGPADVYVVAHNEDELARVVVASRSHGAPVFVLGSGSNILVGDGGIRGVVIENRARAVTGPIEDERGGLRFRAESGTSFAAVARSLARRGYAGLEWASGIPGSLGGAVVYNAGAYGGCLADVLNGIRFVNGTGAAKDLAAGDLGLVYRGSAFSRGQFRDRVVLAAEFTLWPGDPEALMRRVQELDVKRLGAQPRGRNAGSIFKNPAGHLAWRLIDGAGLRGYRIGDAQISDKHCNFFVNAGSARAADVKALIDLARERVRDQYGVELELEIGLVGEGFDVRPEGRPA